MNTAAHPVAPEEVMAFLDGELMSAEAQAVSIHLDQCAECAGLAAQFRSTSHSLSDWTVPPVSSSLFESVEELSAKAAASLELAKPGRTVQLSFWNWRMWAVGAGGMATALLILVAHFVTRSNVLNHRESVLSMAQMSAPRERDQLMNSLSPAPSSSTVEEKNQMAMSAGALISPARAQAGKSFGVAHAGGGGGAPAEALAAPGSMIARTVSLSIAVKDFAAARASLDSILLRHRGYAAQLSATTQENAPRTLQASLRIPAPELAAALAELKALGRVESETQSGDEVTQQHTDLAARIQNSRETEERMRAILEQRTGKIEDVLQVEEEIARVRGEIESMEAEQQALEHRVDFATVDLQLAEEYKAALNPPSASVSNRIHNAFVAGLRSAAETLLGLVLFVEESGPVLLIWLAILGVPVFFSWRRYRRMKGRL